MKGGDNHMPSVCENKSKWSNKVAQKREWEKNSQWGSLKCRLLVILPEQHGVWPFSFLSYFLQDWPPARKLNCTVKAVFVWHARALTLIRWKALVTGSKFDLIMTCNSWVHGHLTDIPSLPTCMKVQRVSDFPSFGRVKLQCSQVHRLLLMRHPAAAWFTFSRLFCRQMFSFSGEKVPGVKSWCALFLRW